ncbi:MAG: formylglycine-generating enzyme family protein [Deltaproteobacteria bacterium]|nr:formylglycine-generating enzyme family protein [Deltaproteobacteria bacterium]
MKKNHCLVLLLVVVLLAFGAALACQSNDSESGRVGGGGESDDDGDDDDDDSGDDDPANGGNDDANDDDNDDDVNDDDIGDDDDTEIEWAPIPAGTFEMGCSPGDEDCDYDELPQHTVILTKDFEMMTTEVTQAQFEYVMGTNPSFHDGCPNCPVEHMTHPEAREFCDLVGGRLPTEAEWEYAARAGTTTRFYCGDNSACLIDVGWFSFEQGDLERPQKVAQLEPNAWGLYDTIGNVAEYVNDWYDSGYYSSRPDPDVDPEGPPENEGSCVTLRNGSFYFAYYSSLRLSARNCNASGYRVASIGFRCARDVEQ